MSGFPVDPFQGVPGASGHPVAPPRPARIPWPLVLLHLAIGGVAVALAVSDGFAAGKAAFASETWKLLLGATGAGIAFTGVRGAFRNLNQSVPSLTDDRRRNARVWGWLLIVAGAGLAAVSLSEDLARRSVAFDSWVDPFFRVGGIYLVLLGLLLQLNPARTLAQQRLAQGQGTPGRATIVRSRDLATTSGDSALVEVELEIEAEGRRTLATSRMLVDEDKLALLVPGSTVEVLVDRTAPDVFDVDWESWQAPAG